MSAATTSAESARAPFHLAGLPLSSWAYATRIWVAMMLALAAGFWLQLESASSAAITVAILAQPRRGEAFRKAAFRFAATVIGVGASIVITGIFTQSRDLFIVAFAAWMALAVYVATLYDGSRAYGAVLSGYTVAIVAVSQIDSPQNVFTNGINRLAAVALGIAAIALINDTFMVPTVYPSVRQRLLQSYGHTRELCRSMVRGGTWQPKEVVDLLGIITGTRLDIQAVSAEGPDGTVRAAAAGSAAVALVNALSKARAIFILCPDTPQEETERLCRAIDANDPAPLEAALDAEMSALDRSRQRVTRLVLAANLVGALRLAADELDAMQAARAPQRRVAMPIHRDRERARLSAARVFLVVMLSAGLFILSSWPMTASAFAQIGVLAGLSSTTPDARAFAKGAMIAFPIAFVMSGITEYIILDGADAFPLFAIGVLPAIFGACFLFLNPKTSPIGFLLLVFVLVLFPPSNPQNYSAQTFLLNGVLDMAGAFIFAIFTLAFFPVTDKDRRRWLVNRARQDLLDALAARARYEPDPMVYLTADRIVALSRFAIGAPSARLWRLRYTLLLSNLTLVVGRGHESLDEIDRAGAPKALVATAHDAFARLDPPALRDSATRLLDAVPEGAWGHRHAAAQAVADLDIAAQLTDANVSTLRHLRHAFGA